MSFLIPNKMFEACLVELFPRLHSYFIFLCFLLNFTSAMIDNEIILDYFVYKRISRVVGYSCNVARDDFSLIRKFNEEGIAASIFRFEDKSSIENIGNSEFWRLGIFVNTRCHIRKGLTNIFVQANNYRMFDELRDWFILGDNLQEVLNAVDDRAFGLSTNFVVAISNDDENYKLYDIYNRHKVRGTELNITFYGTWDLKNNFIIDLVQPKLYRRSNFHNLKLRTMFYKALLKPDGMSQISYYENSPNGIKEGLSKYGYIILRHLGDLFNFSVECFETEVSKPNDDLGPMVRSLKDFQADLAGTPLTMTIPRSFLLRYLHFASPLRTCFIFRNPQQTSIQLQEVLHPFSSSAWYLTYLIISMIILILNFSLRCVHGETRIMKISDSFIITVGAICQQSSDAHLHNISSRIVFIFTLIFSLLMYNYYSACVVSARLDGSIHKINDSLVQFGKLHLDFASEKITYVNLFFTAFPGWETKFFYKNYWSKLPENKRWMDSELGMRLVQKGGFAYHCHPDVGYIFIEKHFNNREICELMEVHLGRPQDTMFSVTNNCTFEEVLRVGLTKISEVGLRNREINKWNYRKPQCRPDILSASSLNMYEFAPYVIILVTGMLISSYVFIIEVIHFKWGIGLRNDFHEHNKKSNLLINIL